MFDENRGLTSPEEISRLEEFIPTRLTCLTLLQVSVTVSMAEFNLLHTLLPVIMGRKVVFQSEAKAFILLHNKTHLSLMLSFWSSTYKAAPGPFGAPAFQPVRPLPAVQFQVERVNVEHSVPMYAPELIGTVSSLSQPSDSLLHHCYAHLYLKVSLAMMLESLIPFFQFHTLNALLPVLCLHLWENMQRACLSCPHIHVSNLWQWERKTSHRPLLLLVKKILHSLTFLIWTLSI